MSTIRTCKLLLRSGQTHLFYQQDHHLSNHKHLCMLLSFSLQRSDLSASKYR